MTVSSETRVNGPYTGNGATVDFAFNFTVFTEADVLVVQTDLDGAETELTLTTDYTVTLNPNQDDNPGGTVTLNSALTTGYLLTLTSQVQNKQLTELTNVGGFYPQVVTRALDKLTVLIQQAVNLTTRSIKIPISDGTGGVTELPTKSVRALKALVFDADGDITVSADNYVDQAANAAASASAAATSASNASSSASAAATSASNASTSATSAAASATAAAATLNSALWRDVVFVTSNVTVDSTYSGKMIVVDTTSGAVTVTLPQISTLTLPFNLGVKKNSSDGNAVSIVRSGTDTIDGGTSKSISITDAGCTLIADTDPSPDEWTTADFGQTIGNMTVDTFSGDGAATGFTLSTAPGSANNAQVYVSGLRSATSAYSIVGTTLTFVSAPPLGTGNIQVVIGTTLPIGTPSDGTVSTTKLGGDVTTAGKALLDDADASAQRTTLGVYDAIVGRAYAEYTSAGTDLTVAIPVDDTVPQNTEGTEVLSVAYAAKTTTNRLRLRFIAFGGQTSGSTKTIVAAIFGSDSASAKVATAQQTVTGSLNSLCVEVEITPGTTSSRTYSVRVGTADGTAMRLNGIPSLGRYFGGAARATLVIEEIRA